MQNVPGRPIITREMVLAAAREVGGHIGGEWAERIADSFRPDMDGYTLARAIDTWGELTMDDVEELDQIPFLAAQAQTEAEKQWVKDNNIQPKLADGTVLRQGVIAGVCEHSPARYMVKAHGCVEEGRFLLVKFEDAEAELTHDA